MSFERGTTVMTLPSAERLAELTAEWFATGADNPHLGARLALADTVVHFHFTDTAGVTLMLDRTPIEALPRIVGEAEVEIWISPEQVLKMLRREEQMAMLISEGEIDYRGPVRKFLRIVPILRSLDYSMWGELLSAEGPAEDRT